SSPSVAPRLTIPWPASATSRLPSESALRPNRGVAYSKSGGSAAPAGITATSTAAQASRTNGRLIRIYLPILPAEYRNDPNAACEKRYETPGAHQDGARCPASPVL